MTNARNTDSSLDKEKQAARRAWLVFALCPSLFLYMVFWLAPKMLAERQAERGLNAGSQPGADPQNWYTGGQSK